MTFGDGLWPEAGAAPHCAAATPVFQNARARPGMQVGIVRADSAAYFAQCATSRQSSWSHAPVLRNAAADRILAAILKWRSASHVAFAARVQKRHVANLANRARFLMSTQSSWSHAPELRNTAADRILAAMPKWRSASHVACVARVQKRQVADLANWARFLMSTQSSWSHAPELRNTAADRILAAMPKWRSASHVACVARVQKRWVADLANWARFLMSTQSSWSHAIVLPSAIVVLSRVVFANRWSASRVVCAALIVRRFVDVVASTASCLMSSQASKNQSAHWRVGVRIHFRTASPDAKSGWWFRINAAKRSEKIGLFWLPLPITNYHIELHEFSKGS